MKFLKGLAISLLSFLLFLSLSIFGLAFTLNNTILNPDFVVSELDRLEVSSLAEGIISEQIPEGEFPEGMKIALVNTITKLEPLVKEQISAATYSVYDYLLGKSQSLDLAHTLRNTILSSDFVVSLVDELDISLLAGEFLAGEFRSEQISEHIPEEIPNPEEFSAAMIDAVDDVIVEFEPWIKEQVNAVAPPILAYLLGESQSLNEVISLEPVIESLPDALTEATLESLTPHIAHLSPADLTKLEQYFDGSYRALAEMLIPPTFEIDETLLGPEIPAEIAKAIAEAEKGLEQGREVIGYFQLGYKALIGFILFLILCIILISREVRSATRKIGTIFLSCGVPWYVGILVAKHFAGTQMAQLDIPSYLQGWLPQFLDNFSAPLEMFSLGLLIGGVVLLIVSFAYKPKQPSS